VAQCLQDLSLFLLARPERHRNGPLDLNLGLSLLRIRAGKEKNAPSVH
jgi:hypothetical protein